MVFIFAFLDPWRMGTAAEEEGGGGGGALKVQGSNLSCFCFLCPFFRVNGEYE